MQSQQRGECSREKGNDLQHLPSEINQVYRDKRDYNLRNRSENKTGSTGDDELREVWDRYRKKMLENNNMKELEEYFDRLKQKLG